MRSPASAWPLLLLLLATTARCAAPTSETAIRAAPAAAPVATTSAEAPEPDSTDDTPRVNASGGPLSDAQAAFDVRHVALDLAVSPARRRIDGSATLSLLVLEPLSQLVLDLDDRLRVTRVSLDGRALDFTHEDGVLDVDLPGIVGSRELLAVRVEYGGQPRVAPRPPWDGGFTWAETADGRPWIATSCQGEGADLWWPCKDHPSDEPDAFDLRVTIPASLFCASNGTLRSNVDNGDGTRTLHWRSESPINNYTVALNIAPYEELTAPYESVTGEPIPISFWVLPENVEKARAILPEFLDHLRFLEETCGPYPFRAEKYGIVETPHLGMEHQTIIAYGNDYRRGSVDYDWLHHHELSHEWWANLVTCSDWSDMWIHEGIGTYMQPLYLEKKFGREAYLEEMQRTSRHNNRRAVAPRGSLDSKEIYFTADGRHDNDIYYKGSWVMHTLRWLLGDETFFVALRRMAYPTPEHERRTDGSQVRFSDTEEIREIVERVANRELDWFFEVYLRQPAVPELVVTRDTEGLALEWRAPIDVAFPMPVPVEVDGELHRVPMPDGRGRLALAPDQSYEIDPDQLVLMARSDD